MAARSLDDQHVAADHSAIVKKTSLEEVVDEVVLVQMLPVLAPSGMVGEGRRSGTTAGPPRRRLLYHGHQLHHGASVRVQGQ